MKKAQSYIATNGVGEEGTGGGIVDFLDASASQKIMSAPPTKGTHTSMSNAQQVWSPTNILRQLQWCTDLAFPDLPQCQKRLII